jgi:hypothetical protein
MGSANNGSPLPSPADTLIPPAYADRHSAPLRPYGAQPPREVSEFAAPAPFVGAVVPLCEDFSPEVSTPMHRGGQ